MAPLRSRAGSMPLAEHLVELRTRLLRIFIVLCLGVVAGFVVFPHILVFLQHPYCKVLPRHCNFLVTNPLDGLSIRVKVSVYFGLLVSLPFFLWHTWRFITPIPASTTRIQYVSLLCLIIPHQLLYVIILYNLMSTMYNAMYIVQ